MICIKMEERENFGAVNAVAGNQVAVSFHGAPRIENNLDFSMATVPVSMPVTAVKKKRGRPRKYGPDGKPTPGSATALSPMPISSSIPLTGEFSAWKRGGGKPVESIKKSSFKFDFESPPGQGVSAGAVAGAGERIAKAVGANFTAYMLTVNSGEDVTMKIMSSQQGSRAICILSATGTISNVTLRQSTSSGSTLTYEGRFEILSLSGSFMPTDNGITKSRSGGMSVSLAGPDGRVLGGGLAGLLIASGPVQVVLGSFLPNHHLEDKSKNQRTEHTISTITHNHPPPHVNHHHHKSNEVSFGGVKPIMTPAAFQEEKIVSFNNNNNVQDSRNNSSADDRDPLPEKDSNHSQSNA
ncbi:variant 2, AT-hook motif nuclear-localized protein 3 [Lathyrus oleraceus]|uniref:AT-hook motif nuclear-localized protein n=1 Tax=Pisum sativum TaxID=3888 RepID=A0A9D5A6Z1_PEA|nr:variant 2, AT-hook motif nuclear-localized protein 3 [Pisum sativum]